MKKVLRARDLVSEQEMWHLVNDVTKEALGERAKYSTLPSAVDCVPANEQELLQSALQETRAFRVATKLPCFMSLHEVAAIRLLGTALVHKKTSQHASVAARDISSAYNSVFGAKLSKKQKLALSKELKNPLSTTQILGIGTFFRHTFRETPKSRQLWSDGAFAHTQAWIDAFRTNKADAEAWSAYLHTMAMCGVFDNDPTFAQNIALQIAGDSHGKLDSLVQSLRGTQRTPDQILQTVRSTLLQAHYAAADSKNENELEI